MPRQYEAIRDSYMKRRMSEDKAQSIAAATYIKRGKGGSRSSRAKALHKPSEGAMKTVVSGYSEKIKRGKK